jgi:hypothetical protein
MLITRFGEVLKFESYLNWPISTGLESLLILEFEYLKHMQDQSNKTMYIYINKDGNPSTISTKHVEANVNTRKENQDQSNNI